VGHRLVVLFTAAAVLAAAALIAGCGSGSSGDGSASGSPASSPSPVASATTVPAQVVQVDSVAVPPATNLKVGDTLVVTLNSNASTGYTWKVEGSGISDTGVLKQVGKAKAVAPRSDLPGAPGKTRFTFQAVKKGSDQLEFWYARPSDPGSPGASYALIVNVAKGHLPVTISATEDYTAETAEIRSGDTLVVQIGHASFSGKAAWKVSSATAPVKLKSQRWSSQHGGTATLTFAGTAAGDGALVLVNQPPGEVPLQTYALPVVVKTPKMPVTVQLTHKDDGEALAVKAGDKIQVSLPEQASTDFTWKFQKPNPKVLKQAGKPKYTANNDTIGAPGKMLWTFKVVGAGKATLTADYVEGTTPDTPIKTFDVSVAAKPGYRPKAIEAVADYPSETTTVKPGDVIQLELAARAGAWTSQGTSKLLKAGKPSTTGGKTVVAYAAKAPGTVTSLLIADGPGAWPNQAYAFSAVIGKGKAPKTVSAAEHRSAKPIALAVGESVTIELPGNPTAGYQWVVDAFTGTPVVEQSGTPTFTPNSELMGAPGVFSVTFKAVAAGAQPLTFLYEGPAAGETAPDGIYMTWVNVQ
jgi:inhibitor of cysteine peptidase